MNHPFSVDFSVCTQQQMLLAECQTTLEVWNEHSAEFCEFHPIGRKAGDELLRLQAKYARAYTVLQNHKHNCSLCRLASRMGGRVPENNSATLFDKEKEMCA